MRSRLQAPRNAHRWWAVLLAISGAAGCSAPPEVADDCASRIEASEWEAAAERCAEESATSGIAAARANLKLERYPETLDWAQRLVGTEQESYGWYLAGKAHQKRDSPDEAIAAFERAAEIAEAEGELRIASVLQRQIVMLHRERTQYRPAIEHASRAAELAARADAPGERVLALSLLCGFFMDIGDLGAARWALDEMKQIRDTDDADQSARISEHEGALRSAEGRYALARAAHEKTLGFSEQLHDGFLRGTHLNLVRANLSLGEVARAREHLRRAEEYIEAEVGETTGLRYYRARVLQAEESLSEALEAYRHAAEDEQIMDDWLWQCEHRSGAILFALGQPEQAEQAFERAIVVVERMRAEMRLDGFKAALLKQKRRPYEELFRIQVTESRAVDALATVERSKARALVEALIDSGTEQTAPSGTRSARAQAGARLEALSALLPAVNESPVTSPRPIDALLRESTGRTVLSYYEAAGRFWLAHVAAGQVRVFELEPDAATIRALSRRWLTEPSDLTIASELGAALLPEALEIQQGSHLYISPDGILRRIPFAALRNDGRFLVETVSISYVPSLTALLAIEEHDVARTGAPIVAADPSGDLPHAQDEARGVVRRVGVEPHIGAELDRQTLMGSGDSSLLHLATHAGIDTAGSWLQLHDDRLYADEVVAARLAPRVVVLAGCSTAVGRFDGVWGTMGTAFLAAGSRSVIASLWSIEDRVTRDFLFKWYDRGGVNTPALSLAKVQREWIEQGVAVQRWAAYVSLGGRKTRREGGT